MLSNSHPRTLRPSILSLYRYLFSPSQFCLLLNLNLLSQNLVAPPTDRRNPTAVPPTDWSHSPTGATHPRRHLWDFDSRHQCSRRECRAQGRYRSTTTTSFVVWIGDKVDSGVGRRQIWVPVSLSVVGWVVGDGF